MSSNASWKFSPLGIEQKANSFFQKKKSPHNPSGAVAPDKTAMEIEKICQENSIYMISDEAYETFYYGPTPKKHFSPSGPNVINLYSFSKCFGMCGWRVGYFIYPKNSGLETALAKIQDSVVMHVPHMSQSMAHIALNELGMEWCRNLASTLEENRKLIYDAISILPDQMVETTGSIYVLCKLPHGINDHTAVAFLSKNYKVIALPCETLGSPGYLRICFSFMKGEKMKLAAEQLKLGLKHLLENPDLSEYETKQ